MESSQKATLRRTAQNRRDPPDVQDMGRWPSPFNRLVPLEACICAARSASIFCLILPMAKRRRCDSLRGL
jgi:hypothetical protein